MPSHARFRTKPPRICTQSEGGEWGDPLMPVLHLLRQHAALNMQQALVNLTRADPVAAKLAAPTSKRPSYFRSTQQTAKQILPMPPEHARENTAPRQRKHYKTGTRPRHKNSWRRGHSNLPRTTRGADPKLPLQDHIPFRFLSDPVASTPLAFPVPERSGRCRRPVDHISDHERGAGVTMHVQCFQKHIIRTECNDNRKVELIAIRSVSNRTSPDGEHLSAIHNLYRYIFWSAKSKSKLAGPKAAPLGRKQKQFKICRSSITQGENYKIPLH